MKVDIIKTIALAYKPHESVKLSTIFSKHQRILAIESSQAYNREEHLQS